MQLRRDTEYALRILYCMVGRGGDKTSPSAGLTLGRLSALSGVPKAAADRMCGRLKDAAFIVSRDGKGGETLYFPASGLRRRSLLDVLKMTEGGVQLCGVFDKTGGFYKEVGPQLQSVQTEMKKILAAATMGDLLKK